MLSMIVPTYNEAGALPILVKRLRAALDGAGIAFELVVVDDNSPDGTGRLAEALAASHPIRVLRRPEKAGLASAVLAGLPIAQGDLIGVMDADLSHPPEVIPDMVRAIVDSADVDLAVGSRYVSGGGIEDWPLRRTLVSAFANVLTRWLTPVRDATSGFFVIRRTAIEGVHLNPIGFKIGLETFARARHRRYVEVPYVFTDRKHGLSKFGLPEVRSFLKQLAILYWAKWRAGSPPRLPDTGAATAGAPPGERPIAARSDSVA
jgi:dolichol-phosphate mannosyltransferase